MPDLNLNDKGPEVAEAQTLLNRAGEMLVADGAFGHGTYMAVREFQGIAGLPVTGTIDDSTWAALRALPDPSPDIPVAAVTLIAQEEVSSRAYYDTHCNRPDYPGGESGVTIGVGYDLGYQANFQADWGGVLTADQISRLGRCTGLTGTAARAAIDGVSAIVVPWQAAWGVFLKTTLPQNVALTKQTFPGPVALPGLCLGALVSLVYNRGAGMVDDPAHPGNRQEMRDIRDAVAAGNLQAVPAGLRSMKRLWPVGGDLYERREHEAVLFEQGLAA